MARFKKVEKGKSALRAEGGPNGPAPRTPERDPRLRLGSFSLVMRQRLCGPNAKFGPCEAVGGEVGQVRQRSTRRASAQRRVDSVLSILRLAFDSPNVDFARWFVMGGGHRSAF